MGGSFRAVNNTIVPVEQVERTILLARGQRVILNADLAELYGVTTKRLNQQVRRNVKRFPFSRSLPHAFTEHGAIMAASVLNTPRAIEASIFVVRAFVKHRELLATHKQVARKFRELEKHTKDHDEKIEAIFEAIRQLMAPPEKAKRKIGFGVKEKRAVYGKRKKRKY